MVERQSLGPEGEVGVRIRSGLLAATILLVLTPAVRAWYPYGEKYNRWQEDRPLMAGAQHVRGVLDNIDIFRLAAGEYVSELPVEEGPETEVTAAEYLPGDQEISFRRCTHIAFVNGYEVVTDLAHGRFWYRKQGEQTLVASRIGGAGPHSIAFNPADGLYYVADTENHRITAFRSLSDAGIEKEAHTIAGVRLERPHDIVVDPDTGWIYALNSREPIVFRFKGLGDQESPLDLDRVLGYSRALTLVDGRLYVIGSTEGKVVEVLDFEKGDYRVHSSYGNPANGPGGSWARTGLVLNDVEFFQGFWYATSFFTPERAGEGNDYNENKFIRFGTWDDFEQGTWEDLSDLLPSGCVPYFLTAREDAIFVAVFDA